MSWYKTLEERDKLTIAARKASLERSDVPFRTNMAHLRHHLAQIETLSQMGEMIHDVPILDLIQELRDRGYDVEGLTKGGG